MLFCLCLLRPHTLSDPSVFPTEFNQCCCCFRCSVSAFEAVTTGNMITIWYCVLFSSALWALDRIHVWQNVDMLEIQHFLKDSLEYLLTQSRPVFSQLLVDSLFVCVHILQHSFVLYQACWPHFPFSLSVDSCYLNSCVRLCKATNHFGYLEMQITLSRYRYSRLNDLLSVTGLFFAFAF